VKVDLSNNTDLSAFSLAGKTALVTGASKGIGKAIAIGLAACGADLALAGRGDMDETATAVAQLNRSVKVIHADLVDVDGARQAAADIAARVDIDILVNNAGTIHRRPALEITPDEWRTVQDVNVTSMFFITQALAEPMLRRGAGKVINIASLLSFQGGLRVSSYAASKHAVVGMTRALANEWASQGVQINAIAPGYIKTDNTSQLRDDPTREAEISGRIPAGRWGTPEELVGAAVFLASSASDYVNGHVLVVDGGWQAR
jgi:2-dehydro-3-deoxy-D-gluconate 5-dehydrogenase